MSMAVRPNNVRLISRNVGSTPVPGTWRVNRGGMIEILCPKCGIPFELKGYKVSDNGTVQVPVICGNIACGWKVTMRLAGWNSHQPRRRKGKGNARK